MMNKNCREEKEGEVRAREKRKKVFNDDDDDSDDISVQTSYDSND